MKEDWNYPVELKQLKILDGNAICKSRLATVDKETGSILGLVGTRYNLIQNEELFEAMDGLKHEVGLELANTHVCKSRRVTIFDYTLRNREVEVEGSQEVSDKINFGVNVINSFTPDTPGQIRIFAKRLVCLNGMTLPKSIGQFAFRQLGDVNRESIQTAIQARITPALDTASTWSKWAGMFPDRTKVSDLINSRLSAKTAEELLKQYDDCKDKSVWGLYNLVTFYISHTAKARNAQDTPMKQMELSSLERDFYKVCLN